MFSSSSIVCPAVTLKELLSFDDKYFIEHAYQTLLGRCPDPEGNWYYLQRLRAGVMKIEILAQLSMSSEFQSKKIEVVGLREAIQRRKLFKLPVIGKLLYSLLENKKYENNTFRPAVKQKAQICQGYLTDTSTSIKNGKIACIIPFYNGSEFIERALSSVFNQTIPANEVIVVNDGSRDKEREYLYSLTHKYPFKIIDKENGGQGSARNAGVTASTSEYICFLDQDDFYLPRHNETLINGIPKGEQNFGWVYADLVEANGDGSVMRTSMVKEHSMHPKRSFIDLLGRDMFILPSASLINRRAFEAIGGFDDQFTGYEDDDLFLRLFRQGWSNTFIDQPVTVWCIHNESTSYSVRMSRSRFRYLAKLITQYPDEPEKARYYFRDLFMPRFGGLIIADAITANSQNSKDKEEIYRILKQYASMVCSNRSVPKLIKKKIKAVVFFLTKWPKCGAYLAKKII